MSIGSISDVVSQVTQIEQQLQQLEDGSLLDSMLGISSDSSGTTGTSSATTSDTTGTSTTGTSSTDFSDALAQAQGTDASAATADPSTLSDSSSFGSLADSALASAASVTGTDSTGTSALGLSSLTGGSSLSGGVTLPASAGTLLTSGQQQFASTLSADTGLSPSVVTAWLLAEESGSAAQSRQAAGNNDWLNIGYTDSGTYGSSDSIWSDPVSAANATAQWLQGQSSVAGYGTASSGIQAILQSVGHDPAAQIAAIQNSGWSSGGYPNLGSLYAEVT